MSYTIQLRRDTATNWALNSPVLAQGEAGLETDTGRAKLGDGSNPWNALPYWDPAQVTAAIQAEAARAQAAEAGLATAYALAAETARAEAAESALGSGTALAGETSRAEAAEGLAAQKASNLSDLASASAARTNLGLGSAATQGTAAFDAAGSAATAVTAETARAETAEGLAAQKAANLSDLANAGAARTNLGLGTSAVQPSTAFDASGSASAAQAAAIAASLPTLAAVTVSASGTLALNRTTQVTATSGALTMTLPASVANSLVVVERSAASTANVAVTGNIRGVAAQTVTLSLASESEMFFADGTTWWPVAGHKTLASLTALFDATGAAATAGALALQKSASLSDVASASAALGNIGGAGKPQATDLVLYVSKNGNDSNDGLSWGTAKLTIGASFAAMPAGGVLNCGAGKWYEAGLVPPPNLTMHGAGANFPTQTVLFANALSTLPSGDLFAVPANWSSCAFDGIVFESGPWNGGGHIFNASTSSCAGLLFSNCYFIQSNAGSCIWYTSNATLIKATWRDCWSQHTPGATVPSWWLVSAGGGIESNTWENMWHTYTGNYAIVINSTSASSYSQGNVIRNFTWELCTGGFVKLLGCRFAELRNLIAYDNSQGIGAGFGTILQDGYYFGRGTGNLPCYNIDVKNVNRLAGFLATRTDTGTTSTTSGSTTVSDTAAQAGDVNYTITGAGIPVAATISSVTAGVGYVISAAATATASGLIFTVTPPVGVSNSTGQWIHNPGQCATTSGSTTVTDTGAVAADLGRPISGPGIPAGAVITAVTSGGGTGYTISAAATATAATGTVSFTVTTAVDVRFAAVARSQISLSQGGGSGTIVDLGNQDVLTTQMGVANATQIINRSTTQSMDVTPVTGTVLSPGFQATGISSGVSAASRYVGATASGHPTTGTYLTGDWVISQAGAVIICTAGGTPGTWAGGGSLTLNTLTANVKADALTAVVGASGLAADASHQHPLQDPLSLGQVQNFLPFGIAGGSVSIGTASNGWYSKLAAGGYAVSNIVMDVVASSGNISVAAYTGTAAGASAAPTGGLLASSGAVACPAIGVAPVSLGSTVTPKMNDWLGISCDNTTATFYGNVGVTNTIFGGMYYTQASAHPLPGTPTPGTGATTRMHWLKGS